MSRISRNNLQVMLVVEEIVSHSLFFLNLIALLLGDERLGSRTTREGIVRSGHAVSVHVNQVLISLLKLHPILLVTPKPVDDECSNDRWKCFKGCLGALDGTYIDVKVALSDKPRYRNRKGGVSFNVLGVVDRNMNFIYILPGWEGSAADGRVLRDAVSKPIGLKVRTGQYYLVDNGYMNCPRFLAPFRGIRYHLDDWAEGSLAPQNNKELYNLRHTKARNVIERTWGIMKERWAILRSMAFYPIRTQNRMILACALLHNFIRGEVEVDPLESIVPDLHQENYSDDQPTSLGFVETIDPSNEWAGWRDNLAIEMFNEWTGGR